MKISDIKVIVTCPAGQTYTLVKIITDEGPGPGSRRGQELICHATRD